MARKRIVILCGLVPLASLCYGLLLPGLYLPHSSVSIALCFAAAWLVTWKAKYAPNITWAELTLALCAAAFSVLLNLLVPPAGRTPWAWLMGASLVAFALIGTPIRTLWAVNRVRSKNQKPAEG